MSTSAAAAFLATLGLAAIGWHEDGFWGMLYRVRHPLGTAMAGDDRAPWMWFAAAWLLIAAGVLSGVVVMA